MKLDNFFTELRRRNVFRAAAFYAASSWLLVQVATQLFPFFQILNWIVRWIVVAAAIGFPFWPEFQRQLTEWGMAESWDRAEAWRRKNLPQKGRTAP